MIRFIFIISWLVSPSLSAQTTEKVHGVVMDSLAATFINGATVIVYSGEQVLGYSITNASGAFEVPVSSTAINELTIECRHISYAEKKLIVQQGAIFNPIKIQLTPSSKTLSEIIVESDSWAKNDTTDFIIDSTIDVRSKKIEDLLKTLPNFEVKDNGRILYNNKEVGTVLINGENLSGSNYGVVTKNLDADILQKVQVIDNYSENRIIGSVFKTGDLALNLLTKEELEGKLNGSVKLGSSLIRNHIGELNLIGIKKRKQVLLVSDWNSIGENKNPDFRSQNRSAVYSQITRENDYFETTALNSITFPLMEENYKPDEKQGGVFLSAVFPVSARLKVIERFSVRSMHSNLSTDFYNKTILPDSTVYELYNVQRSSLKILNWSNSITVKYDNLKRTALETEVGVQIKNSSSQFTQLQSGSYSDTAISHSSVPYAKYFVTVSGATRIAKHKAIGFGVNAYILKDDGKIDFNTNRLNDFYNLPAFFQMYRQRVSQNNAVAIVDALYLTRLKKGSLSLKLSHAYYNNEMNRMVFADTTRIGKDTRLLTDATEMFRYNKSMLQLTANHITRHKHQLKIDAALGMYQLQDISGGTYLHYILRGDMYGRLYKNIIYNTALSSRNTLLSPSLVLKDSLIDQVSMMTLSTPQYKPVTIHTYGVRLSKPDWLEYSLGYDLRWMPNSYTQQINYNPKLSFVFYDILGEYISHDLQFGLKAYSLKLKGTFNVNVSARHQVNDGIVNGVSVTNVLKQLSPSVRYISNFKGAYNFEVNYRHHFNDYTQKGNNSVRLKNSDFLISFAQRIIFSESFVLGFSNGYHKFQNGSFVRFDLTANWYLNSKWQLSVKGVNLLNSNSFKNQFNDVNNMYRFETAITKPFVLFSVNRKF